MASSDDILMESEPEHHGSRNELSNSDQMSLMNTVIYRALERQRKILIDHIDSKLDTVNSLIFAKKGIKYSTSLIPNAQISFLKSYV